MVEAFVHFSAFFDELVPCLLKEKSLRRPKDFLPLERLEKSWCTTFRVNIRPVKDGELIEMQCGHQFALKSVYVWHQSHGYQFTEQGAIPMWSEHKAVLCAVCSNAWREIR